MSQNRRTRTSRILSICAWVLMVALGLWEIKIKDHGWPGLSPLFQIAVALIAVVSETTALIQEPK